MDSLFLEASRQKLRFSSPKGELSVEQVWDLPLTSIRGESLDGLATGIHSELHDLPTVSFVDTAKANPKKAKLELQLEVLKKIIEVRMAENAAVVSTAARKAEAAKLREILAVRQEGALEKLSNEELQERLRVAEGRTTTKTE